MAKKSTFGVRFYVLRNLRCSLPKAKLCAVAMFKNPRKRIAKTVNWKKMVARSNKINAKNYKVCVKCTNRCELEVCYKLKCDRKQA